MESAKIVEENLKTFEEIVSKSVLSVQMQELLGTYLLFERQEQNQNVKDEIPNFTPFATHSQVFYGGKHFESNRFGYIRTGTKMFKCRGRCIFHYSQINQVIYFSDS